MSRIKATKDTRSAALREAKGLLQSYGFAGFSFQDVADGIGIKKPSLYEHFASKEALGRTLVADYLEAFTAWGETVGVFAPLDQIGALFELFHKFAADELKVCPLSALVGEYHTLPKTMRKALGKAAAAQRGWLEATIARGQKDKSIRRDQTAAALADGVFALAFGAQQLARISEDAEAIRRLKEQALAWLNPNV